MHVEGDVVTLADETVVAEREAVPVDLEPVPEPGLHDAVTALDLADQPVDVTDQIVRDAVEMRRHDRAEQQTPESRCRVDGQHHVPERHPPGGNRRSGVPDLEFGEQHLAPTRQT